MNEAIRIGVRPSALAVKQAEEIGTLIPCERFEIVQIRTSGDKDKITPLSAVEGSDFFTREIETALLEGTIDAAVHSAKDVEERMPPGLVIAAVTAPISPFECLVSRMGGTLAGLPAGAVVGTSSQKRREALLRIRPDLKVKDIRGTIEERLRQLDNGSFDALIMAHAALTRLGLEGRISEIIPLSVIEPHPLQGSLAIQVRADDERLVRLFSALQKP